MAFSENLNFSKRMETINPFYWLKIIDNDNFIKHIGQLVKFGKGQGEPSTETFFASWPFDAFFLEVFGADTWQASYVLQGLYISEHLSCLYTEV